ncbi:MULTISPECIES: helix-turn-helix transcriptional regulator [Calothrix]|uniref:Helix-turn-helix transcriptional regulator n=2 Tax=Calothrix TaxID=1186 RepID=A0ABR8AGC3_9CYAN|nr:MULTISPECIES: AraC family transcriptional regulator [Calothrix]MBD2198071.1 helix-turn-helix transcriptional regulator [Calothrix parietina FACHB-288]MBD2226506.1 helix-turn-helix transcriptional regulator [Calothrix anomala FACHB-343]
MGNSISLADYQELWMQYNQNAKPADLLDPNDVINLCPKQLGRGYERWIELRDISLLIIDTEFYDDLILNGTSEEDFIECLEFGFHLLGYWNETDSGQNFLLGSGIYKDRQLQVLGQQRLLKVDIHLESPELLNSFISSDIKNSPQTLQRVIEPSEEPYRQISHTTPEMRVALEQIINCPFTGLTKKIYLESKCLELIALKVEQLINIEKSYTKAIVLQRDDIARIHYAKEILTQNLDNPPSLLELARKVGLNDYKLKLGFRQVLGTTAFSYLQQQRMEKARQLLLESKMSVKQIARAVGYANQSRFAAAFRKQFGTNPKSYDLLIKA